jgi:hypothetical protein
MFKILVHVFKYNLKTTTNVKKNEVVNFSVKHEPINTIQR